MVDRYCLAHACALVLALSACSFEEGVGPDAGSIPDVTVAFGSDGTTIDEDSGTITLPVTLSGVSTHEVRVDFTIGSATTATRPDDFTLSDGSLIFMPGQTEKTIEITIAKDSVEESDETIVVQLGQPIGATLGMKASYTVTISADILPRVSFADPAPSNAAEATSPQVEVKLTTPPKSPVTVELGVAGTASLADRAVSDGQLITFAANQTSVLVPLGVVPDLVDEDDETIELTLKNPSVGLLLATTNLARSHTIADDDLPPTIGFAASTSSTNENQPIGLTVELSAPSGRIITVDYAAAFGTASAADATVTGAPGTLTFMPGETSKAISVAVANDSLDENNETLSVTLANPINATLTTATNTLTINDDDNPPSVAFAQAAASTNETMTAVNVTVQLSAASSFAVTVPFSVGAASTADNPEDYTLASTAALTIPAGMTSATITVNVKADTLDEANETVVLSLGTPTNASAGSITTETLTITDDDAPPSVAFTSTGSSPNEGNSNITLTVQLSDISGQDVTIPFAIDAASTATDPDDYTISPPSPVVIPAGNTSTTITIAMKEDTLYESDETVIVALGTPTNATLATPATYTFTIKDDDQEPSVSWNPAESNLSEPEGTQGSGTQTRQVTYTMVLSAASGLPVSVPIMYTGTATFGTDYTGPATVMFQPGETSTNVVLEIVKDLVPEPGPAETITMTINSGGVTNATPQMPLVRAYSIQDDD